MSRSTRRSILLCAISIILLIFPALLSAQDLNPYRDSNGLYGYKNSAGQIVIPSKYEYAKGFYDGLAQVKIDDKYGYIDKDDNMVIPAKYSSVGYFGEGLVDVRDNGKSGFVDKNNNLIIPLKYDSAEPFSYGLACVAK